MIQKIYQPIQRLFQGRAIADKQRATSQRYSHYQKMLRAYLGYSIRGYTNTGIMTDWKRIRYNFHFPIVNIGAAWLAAKPLNFVVDGDTAATQACYEIWTRSGGQATLLDNAVACAIYGEICGVATQNSTGQAMIEFLDPNICLPTFAGSDYSKLIALETSYETINSINEPGIKREMWMENTYEQYMDDNQIGTSKKYSEIPAVWIRNMSVKGVQAGISDIELISDLVEQYDHLSTKEDQCIDYYSSPTICITGAKQGDTHFDKGMKTVLYLPPGATVNYLEWTGPPPNVDLKLQRLRDAISEISQVPEIAFGETGSSVSHISGIAIQILYEPLTVKTHAKQAQWTPALQYLMWLALRAEGHAVAPETIKIKFASATPVDGQSNTAIASAKVAARLTSRRTIMNDLGIADPDSELKRIIVEEKLLELVESTTNITHDANTAARAGAKGLFAAEQPFAPTTDTGNNTPAPTTTGNTVPPRNTLDEIQKLLSDYDTITRSEEKNLGDDPTYTPNTL